ncbi:polysaccharide biosynthesis/export family protein [Methylobacter sp.]|uniref:polysaccharide biosynthesis/export family protein n=1 Tax=Methylobacter sp. TaxID=2051955 RepID=UPI003DA22A8D
MKKNLIFMHLLSIISLVFFVVFNLHAEDQKDQQYRLGSGDKLKITVFNHDDLTGEYTVDGAGNVSVPLIGTVTAKDLSLQEFEELLRSKLSPDYILNPKFSIQMLNYRPFYILGEVEKPDSYPYVSGMTYLTAVAIAGGFTYRAKQGHVFVIHANDATQKEVQANMDMPVMPGDIIRVDERMF